MRFKCNFILAFYAFICALIVKGLYATIQLHIICCLLINDNLKFQYIKYFSITHVLTTFRRFTTMQLQSASKIWSNTISVGLGEAVATLNHHYISAFRSITKCICYVTLSVTILLLTSAKRLKCCDRLNIICFIVNNTE